MSEPGITHEQPTRRGRRSLLARLAGSNLQCAGNVDGDARFREDAWQRAEGGGGRTRVLVDGAVFEQGGVNYSQVEGAQLPPAATAHRPELVGRAWTALGVSLVLHPHNPYVPTTHLNVRFFEARKQGTEPVWWFGGGFDLTPFYAYDEDIVLLAHDRPRSLRAIWRRCLPRSIKNGATTISILKHRNETRGVGGLFFDDLECLGFRTLLRLSKGRWQWIPGCLCPDCREAERRGFRRMRTRVSTVSPRPLRRIQSGLRPRHPVRPAVGWTHRIDPDVATAARALRVRLCTGSRFCRSCNLPNYLKPREWL